MAACFYSLASVNHCIIRTGTVPSVAARATPHAAGARSISSSPSATSPDAVRLREAACGTTAEQHRRGRRNTSGAKLQSSPAAEDYGRAAKLKGGLLN